MPHLIYLTWVNDSMDCIYTHILVYDILPLSLLVSRGTKGPFPFVLVAVPVMSGTSNLCDMGDDSSDVFIHTSLCFMMWTQLLCYSGIIVHNNQLTIHFISKVSWANQNVVCMVN